MCSAYSSLGHSEASQALVCISIAGLPHTTGSKMNAVSHLWCPYTIGLSRTRLHFVRNAAPEDVWCCREVVPAGSHSRGAAGQQWPCEDPGLPGVCAPAALGHVWDAARQHPLQEAGDHPQRLC